MKHILPYQTLLEKNGYDTNNSIHLKTAVDLESHLKKVHEDPRYEVGLVLLHNYMLILDNASQRSVFDYTDTIMSSRFPVIETGLEIFDPSAEFENGPKTSTFIKGGEYKFSNFMPPRKNGYGNVQFDVVFCSKENNRIATIEFYKKKDGSILFIPSHSDGHSQHFRE